MKDLVLSLQLQSLTSREKGREAVMLHQNDVILILMWRDYVALTSVWCHFDVLCLKLSACSKYSHQSAQPSDWSVSIFVSCVRFFDVFPAFRLSFRTDFMFSPLDFSLFIGSCSCEKGRVRSDCFNVHTYLSFPIHRRHKAPFYATPVKSIRKCRQLLLVNPLGPQKTTKFTSAKFQKVFEPS